MNQSLAPFSMLVNELPGIREYSFASPVPDIDNGRGDFPISEDCASRIFSLPMHPYLRAEDQKRITQLLQP